MVRSVVAGALWGVLAALSVIRLRWYVAAGMLVAGPLIGAAIYWFSRWSYRSRYATILWTVPSVIIATGIFGLTVGLLDSIERGREMILESLVFSVWGVIVPSPFWLLYPLALITHFWVQAGAVTRREKRDPANAI